MKISFRAGERGGGVRRETARGLIFGSYKYKNFIMFKFLDLIILFSVTN